MLKRDLTCIFCIGRRCNSIDFLNQFKLRKFSGPFDHLMIDFETSLQIINTKFENFLYDIITFNKNQKKIELLYKKHTTEINNKFYELLENDLGYMGNNYNNSTEIFNQNFLDETKLDKNMYNWNKICSFHHHNLADNNVYNIVKNRVDRFNYAFQKYNSTTSLFFITKIVACETILHYMNEIIELKLKYGRQCFIIVIMPSDNGVDNHYYNESNKCLFIVKKVENYNHQYYHYRTDNDTSKVNYENEYNIIIKYFNLNLIEKNEL